MPEDVDPDHAAQAATMEFLHQASHLPGIEAASHPLAAELADHDRDHVVAFTTALLIEPSLHVHSLRLESLLCVALVHGRGDSAPRQAELARWLNDYLGKTDLQSAEDPPEDAFVVNVVTAAGNRRIFQGNWIGNDFWLQEILGCVDTMPTTGPYARLRRELDALLLLSESLAVRSELPRGTPGGGNPQKDISLPDDTWLSARASTVVFTDEDLRQLGITAESLASFTLTEEQRTELAVATLGQSPLERYPICRVRDGWILALPSAVANAAIGHVLRFVQRSRHLDALQMMLRTKQGDRAFNEALGTMKVKAAGLELPRRPATLTCCDVVADGIDDDKLALVVLLHDDIEAVLRDGMASQRELEPVTVQVMNTYLRECIVKLSLNQPGFAGGLLIVIMGGVGRGFRLLLEDMMPGWELLVFSLADFSSLGWVDRISLLRLWKLVCQRRRLSEANVTMINANGDFSLFAQWHRSGYWLLPSQVPFPAINAAYVIDSSAAGLLRRELRDGYDEHGVFYRKECMVVRRMSVGSFFDAAADRPIFASSELAREGRLSGVAETAQRGWWVECEPNRGLKVAADIHFRLWEALLNWMGRFAFVLEEEFRNLPAGSIHIQLKVEGIDAWTEHQMPDRAPEEIEPPKIGINRDGRVLWLTLPSSFLEAFRRPENDGEREMLLRICLGAATLCDERISRHHAKRIVARVMPDSQARFFHILPAGDFRIHARLEGRMQPRFICEEDKAASRLGFVREFWQTSAPADVKSACRFLNDAVEHLWQRIRGRLEGIDCASAVSRCLRNVEAIAVDEDQWRISAGALLAWHGDEQMVKDRALQRESERAIAGIASRVMCEMAICACANSGGRVCSQGDFDAVLADIEFLIMSAHASDAIRAGFVPPRIEFTPSGDFTADMSFLQDVVNPYLSGHFKDGFTSAAEGYAKHFEKTERTADSVIPPEFSSAFEDEYGVTPVEAVEANAALGRMAYHAKVAVLSVKESEALAYLGAELKISPIKARRFLNEFSLTRRLRWDDPEPAPFRQRDWYPWRFRRRLSLYARPFVRVADSDNPTIIFAPGLCEEGFNRILMGAYAGDFANEHYVSPRMRAWIGKANDERGHRLNDEMAEEIRSFGWEAEASVQIERLGGPRQLGDVDVLAWNSQAHVILAIECKRLQMARTIGEIVEQLKRFRGEADDDLGVHLRRVDWLRNHVEQLAAIAGFSIKIEDLTPVLLTNTIIPSRYMPSQVGGGVAMVASKDLSAFLQQLSLA